MYDYEAYRQELRERWIKRKKDESGHVYVISRWAIEYRRDNTLWEVGPFGTAQEMEEQWRKLPAGGSDSAFRLVEQILVGTYDDEKWINSKIIGVYNV